MVKVRLALIVALLFLSVVVDSVYYLVSAATDGILAVLIVIIALPLVKRLLKE